MLVAELVCHRQGVARRSILVRLLTVEGAKSVAASKFRPLGLFVVLVESLVTALGTRANSMLLIVPRILEIRLVVRKVFGILLFLMRYEIVRHVLTSF